MKPTFIFMQIGPQFSQKAWPMGLGLLGPQKNSLLEQRGFPTLIQTLSLRELLVSMPSFSLCILKVNR